MKLKLTFLSDTHNFQKLLPVEEIGTGDIVFHSGDISSQGFEFEVRNFLDWYNSLNYTYKVFIAGNHDLSFEHKPELIQEILEEYPDIIYLEDSLVEILGLKVYGAPWQPEFYDWAFNLPRNGPELEEKWNKIPDDTDVLLTHGPPHKINDTVINRPENLGCEKLLDRVLEVKPLIHSFGHIHTGRGVKDFNGTLFLNSSILDERYRITYPPHRLELDLQTKEIKLL